MSKRLLMLVSALLFMLPAFGQLQVNPTTTLTVQTGNNTSGADAFVAQSNGNAAPGNVSKISIRSLLYTGSTTKVYAHFMPWFGRTNHMWVGYDSSDPAQVARQVNDMISRGYDGMVIDWYGPGKFEDTVTLRVKAEAEKHTGFQFAVMEDKGAIDSAADKSGKIINDLNYAYSTYYSSSAYMRMGGRPVAFFFGVDAYSLDWNRIRAGVKGNPLFVFRQNSGFTHIQSDGGYSWVGIASDGAAGLGYLDSFYSTALKYPTKIPVGSVYKGFNNSLAAWVSNPPKIVDQACGQSWLATLAENGKYYSATKQLPAIEVVTWNDYEEGSEVETGIDNCVAVSSFITGSQLNWSIAGEENTLAGFKVFISLDGQNLMELATLPASARNIDLEGFSPVPGTPYTLHVQALGKSGLFNHMSNPAGYTEPWPSPTVSVAAVADGPIVQVTASAHSGNPAGSITAMIVYVDSVKQLTVNGDRLTARFVMPAGVHKITVNAWDGPGPAGSTSVQVTADVAIAVELLQ